MKQNNKTSLYISGAILGLILGLVSVYFYDRAKTENNPDQQAANLDVSGMIKLGLLLMGVVRQIAELGAENGKDQKKSK